MSNAACEPASAYREPRWERFARWVRRHKSGTQIGLFSAAAILVLTIGATLWLGKLASSETKARKSAEIMTGDVARTNARLVARTMASDINLRLLVLREDSRDDALRSLLARFAEKGDDSKERTTIQTQLQNWLYERAQEREPLAGKNKKWAGNWFIYNAEGTQLARVPYKDGGQVAASINQNFAYRSYFSGKDRDMPKGTKQPPHTRVAHISAVYRSVVDKDYKVGFTVPVWSSKADGNGQRKVIGMLGVTIDLGEIAAVDIGNVSLIDLRKDYLEDPSGRRGLILHHPRLHERLTEVQTGDGKSSLPRIGNDLVKRMQAIRAACAAGRVDATNLLERFAGPLDVDAGTAAFEPVIVDGDWPAAVRDIGWVVLVKVRGDGR